MQAKDVIRQSLGMADMLLNGYTGDLSDSEILLQPVEGMNHIAWQIGHLVSTERVFVEMIKPGNSPALTNQFEEVHSRTETKGTKPEDFLTKDAYMAIYNAQRAVTLKVLDELTDAELDSETEGNIAKFAPTFGALLNMIALHYLMHLGQFVAVRRTAQKPIAI